MGWLSAFLGIPDRPSSVPANSVPPAPKNSTSDLAASLVCLQYQSLRGESEQAMQKQNTIVQYSLATGTVLLAATLAYRGQNPTASFEISAIVFGIIAPILFLFLSMTWLGELHRLERVGYYLRGLERAVWSRTPDAPIFPTYENFIAFHGQDSGLGKQRIGYIGSSGCFVGSVFISLVFLLLTFHQSVRSGQISHHWLIAAWSWSVVVFAADFAIVLGNGIRLWRAARKWAPESLFNAGEYAFADKKGAGGTDADPAGSTGPHSTS